LTMKGGPISEIMDPKSHIDNLCLYNQLFH
jgi:hypothetical protein